MIRNIRNKKYFKLVIAITSIIIILFIFAMIILKYNVEGETNMPFQLSKISVVSSLGGIDKQSPDTKWAFDLYQSNDIYLYINKNEGYGKTEVIKSVEISNIQTEGKQKDNIKIYKPDKQEEKLIFKNKEENSIQNLEYQGDVESNLKQLKISNQGGIVALRCSIDNLTTYASNEEEINHQELLKKAEVNQEDLKTKLTFDLKLKLENGNEYKTTITLDFPVGNVVEEGTVGTEITEVKDFVFKRL